METFVTWEMLANFSILITITFALVEVIKELPFFKELKTKYLAIITAFVLITITNIVLKTFVPVDLLLYLISAVFVSTSAMGISDYNNPVDKTSKE